MDCLHFQDIFHMWSFTFCHNEPFFKNLQLSDNICTGLQLINFIQDIDIDCKNRDHCYFPTDELEQYNLNIEKIANRTDTQNYRDLVNKNIQRAQEIYKQGVKLGDNLPGLFGVEIRFIIACGNKILQKLAARNNIFQKPILSKTDMFIIFLQTVCKQRYTKYAQICSQF